MSKARSKTEKKIDNNVRLALTAACEQFLEDIPGFQWLTHQANYTNFPASLLITCVFETRADQRAAEPKRLQSEIQAKLLKIGVKIKAPDQQIVSDSEQACAEEHSGNWADRLATRQGRSVRKRAPT